MPSVLVLALLLPASVAEPAAIPAEAQDPPPSSRRPPPVLPTS